LQKGGNESFYTTQPIDKEIAALKKPAKKKKDEEPVEKSIPVAKTTADNDAVINEWFSDIEELEREIKAKKI